MTQVQSSFKPPAEDTELKQLLDDCKWVMRQKTDSVVHMRNTIKYSEKVRQVWEDRVLKTLSNMDKDSDCDEDLEDNGNFTPAIEEPPPEAVELGASNNTSSTKLGYTFNGDEQTA